MEKYSRFKGKLEFTIHNINIKILSYFTNNFFLDFIRN